MSHKYKICSELSQLEATDLSNTHISSRFRTLNKAGYHDYTCSITHLTTRSVRREHELADLLPLQA